MTPPNPTAGWDAEREAKRLNSKLVPAVMRKEADAICEKYLRAAYDAGRSYAPSAEVLPEALALIERLTKRRVTMADSKAWDMAVGDATAFLARVRGEK